MTEPRVLGEISSYQDLHAIMRARAAELELSRESIDAIAGVPAGYAAKLLAPRPIRTLGALSMPLMLPALGIKVLVVVDDAKTADIKGRRDAERRNGAQVRAGTVHFELSDRHMRKIRFRGGKNSRTKMSKRKARELGRKAAIARWHKPVIVEITTHRPQGPIDLAPGSLHQSNCALHENQKRVSARAAKKQRRTSVRPSTAKRGPARRR